MPHMVLLAILVLTSVLLVVYSLWPSRSEEEGTLKRRMLGNRASHNQPIIGQKRKNSAAREMLDKVTPLAMKPIMPRSDAEMSALKAKLAQAGYRSESASRYFLASKTFVAVGLGVLVLLVAGGAGYEPRKLFGIVATSVGVGFMLPNAWLLLGRMQRAEKVRNGLPDSLDLLVVSVESGLGLDAGLARVSEEMRTVHPELSEEMQIATLENQMGMPRSEALEHMAVRCGVEEMRALVAVIIQAERFGTSVAKTLRTQADTLRAKRRLRAEERAQKTTVKLMVPLILFIFPSIFVVLVGPAILQLVKTLGSGGTLGG